MRALPLTDLPRPVQDILRADERFEGAVVSSTAVVAWGSCCTHKTRAEALAACPGATGYWTRPASGPHASSKTRRALAMLASGDARTPAEAARAVGIHHSGLYRALAEREARGVCSCCGQALPRKPD